MFKLPLREAPRVLGAAWEKAPEDRVPFVIQFMLAYILSRYVGESYENDGEEMG